MSMIDYEPNDLYAVDVLCRIELNLDGNTTRHSSRPRRLRGLEFGFNRVHM